MTPHQITGRLIRKERKKAGLSQGQLAASIGVKKSAVCRWERGYRAPSHEKLVLIALALNVCPAALMPTTDDIKVSSVETFPVDGLGGEGI